MAPRKDATGPVPSASQTQQNASSEGIEDFELPRLLVTQLAKAALPPDAKLEDDTITALVKGSTVFINYLTSAAQDIAAGRAHKTISGADVLKALEALQFGDFVPMFQGDLEVFRQGYRNKTKAATDSKTKSRDSPTGTKSVSTRMSATSTPPAPPAASLVVPPEDIHEPPNNTQNGVSAVDAEMRDASHEGTDDHEAKVTLPVQ